MQQASVQSLKILFVTDLHLNFQTISRLHMIPNKFDFCLVGGDIANVNQGEDQKQMLRQTQKVLLQLQQTFKVPVLFIPGNHDHPSYLNQPRRQHLPNIFNIHKSTFTLADNLQIIGLGGSTPAYTDREHIQTQVWQGYPYNSEAQFKIDLRKCEPSMKQTIYLTHVGPNSSNTTVDRRDKAIYAGCKALDEVLMRQNVVAMLHGHVHFAGKYDLINGIPIINPGCLFVGQYMHFTLIRLQNKWVLQNVCFEKIL